jgi:hypothetical protein
MYESLETAVKMKPELKSKIATDMEFAKYFNEAVSKQLSNKQSICVNIKNRLSNEAVFLFMHPECKITILL